MNSHVVSLSLTAVTAWRRVSSVWTEDIWKAPGKSPHRSWSLKDKFELEKRVSSDRCWTSRAKTRTYSEHVSLPWPLGARLDRGGQLKKVLRDRQGTGPTVLNGVWKGKRRNRTERAVKNDAPRCGPTSHVYTEVCIQPRPPETQFRTWEESFC